MRRADRLFRIVQLLRNRRFATAADLAEVLEVSPRTIYRDINDLSLSGVPIRGETGVGYTLDRAFDLPPMTFTATEIEALVLGMRIVSAWGDPGLANAATSLLEKVEGVLPESLRGLVQTTALFVPSGGWTAHKSQWLEVVRAGINQRRVLRFEYVRADGTPSSRTVRPLGLYFWGDKWSLAAWCELREDYRNFRPDRMDAVTLGPLFPNSSQISLNGFKAKIRARRAMENNAAHECSEP